MTDCQRHHPQISLAKIPASHKQYLHPFAEPVSALAPLVCPVSKSSPAPERAQGRSVSALSGVCKADAWGGGRREEREWPTDLSRCNCYSRSD